MKEKLSSIEHEQMEMVVQAALKNRDSLNSLLLVKPYFVW